MIKQLTGELKEEKEMTAEMAAKFSKASAEIESFKKSFNFRLNLAKSREQMLLKDHFKKFEV